MVLQRLASRPQSAWTCSNCLARLARSSRQTQRRNLHSVPQLPNNAYLQTRGIPGLFSPEGFDMAWTQYQGMMIDKVNDLTAGTQHENVTTQTLLLSTARDPMLASLFNHASQAYNNDFFFKGIVLHDPHTSRLPASLADKLSTNFSSLEALRSTFLNTAQAMFGPGYVWLVRTRDPNQMGNQVMRILTTYIAGSPLPGAHWRQQPADMNVHNNVSAAQAGLSPADYARQTQVQNTVGMAGQYSAMAQRDKQIAPGGADTLPLLCVSTWEHTWIRDWGMEGKRRFLEAWWDRINWEAVAHSLEKSGSR